MASLLCKILYQSGSMLIYMVKYMHNTSTSSYYLPPVLKLCQLNLKIAQNNL